MRRPTLRAQYFPLRTRLPRVPRAPGLVPGGSSRILMRYVHQISKSGEISFSCARLTSSALRVIVRGTHTTRIRDRWSLLDTRIRSYRGAWDTRAVFRHGHSIERPVLQDAAEPYLSGFHARTNARVRVSSRRDAIRRRDKRATRDFLCKRACYPSRASCTVAAGTDPPPGLSRHYLPPYVDLWPLH